MEDSSFPPCKKPLKFLTIAIIFIHATTLASMAQIRREIIPLLECIEYIGNGKYRADFGYDNPGKAVTVAAENSYTLIEKQKFSAINTFKIGRQVNVFSKEFEPRHVIEWTIILPNGKIQKVISSINSKHCTATEIIKPEPCYTFDPSERIIPFLARN